MSISGAAGNRAAAVALGCALAAVGCDKPGVAQLASASGTVEAALSGKAWRPAAIDSWFSSGDALKTGVGSTAVVAFRRSGRLRLDESTLIRFGQGQAPDALAIDLELGTSEVETESDELILELGGRRVAVTSDSRVALVARQDAVRLDVILGAARVQRASGETEAVPTGGQIELEVTDRTGAPSADDSFDAGAVEADVATEVSDAGVEFDAAPSPGVEEGEVDVVLKGRPARIRKPGKDGFSVLRPGADALLPGTNVRLPGRARLSLTRGEERAVLRGPAVATIGGAGEPLFVLERGTAQITARAEDVRVDVPGGTIVARRGKGDGSQASIEVQKRSSSVRVQTGVVEVSGGSNETRRLAIGGNAVLSREGAVQVRRPIPPRPDLTMRAGQTVVVHDPQPPTAVAVDFGELCTDQGVVELAAGRILSAGEGRAVIPVARPEQRYRVRCLTDGVLDDKPRASGRIVLRKDSGAKPLATRSPRNRVDADGRVYTVLYQNLLPIITFRWRGLPAERATDLVVVDERGKVRTFAAPGGVFEARAGTLDEGTYKYYFRANGRRSNQSTLRIEFDNAAPSVYVERPKVRGTWKDSVSFEGATLAGWNVFVGGTPVPVDSQGRFAATVSVSPRVRGVAVRLTHPKRGVHYYVRRSSARK